MKSELLGRPLKFGDAEQIAEIKRLKKDAENKENFEKLPAFEVGIDCERELLIHAKDVNEARLIVDGMIEDGEIEIYISHLSQASDYSENSVDNCAYDYYSKYGDGE